MKTYNFTAEQLQQYQDAAQREGYSPEHPLWPELMDVAERVLTLHHREQLGISVPRVLGREYLWFSGDGVQNYFRCEYKGSGVTVDAEV